MPVDRSDRVVLVDPSDRPVGLASKDACHRHPVPLHRAISVFLFDASGRLLLAERSARKTTWPERWSNACCTHPREDESPADAARRRVLEELGIDVTLTWLHTFVYASRYDEEHGEHELDHVFWGRIEGEPTPDPAEVAAWRLARPGDLAREMDAHPARFTPWFRLSVDRVLAAVGERGRP